MKFSKYRNLPPSVLCGIDQFNTLNEEIGYHGFIGNQSDIEGYKHISDGVFETPDGYHVHHDGTKQVKFKGDDSLDRALEFADLKKKKNEMELWKTTQNLKMNTPQMPHEDSHVFGLYANNLNHFAAGGVSLNEHLHYDLPLNERQHDFVSRLNTALDRNKTQGLPDVIYTGTNKAHAEKLRSNDQVISKGFLSTSPSIRAAIGFAKRKGGDIIAIHGAKKGTFIGQGISNYEGETEVLLPTGQRLHIDHSKRQVLMHGDSLINIHHATLKDDAE